MVKPAKRSSDTSIKNFRKSEDAAQNGPEYRKVQEALDDSERKYRDLVELLSQTVFEIDQTGTITFVNPAALKSFGYTMEDFKKGINVFQVFAQKDHDRLRENIQRILRGERMSGIEYTALKKDGSMFPVLTYSSTISRNNIPVGLRGILVDITERKWGEEALRESEEKYRRFFNTSHDCVFITSKDGSWIDFNDAAVELFGYAGRDELMKVKIADLYTDPTKRKEHIRIILEKGFSKEYPVDLRKKDGTILHTLVTADTQKDSDGHVIGFQGAVRDITELKRAEEALILTLKRLNLLNSITGHDIKNQLMALDVFIQLSRDMTNDPALRELFDKEAKMSAIIAEQITFTKDYQELGEKAPGWQNVHANVMKAAAALPMRKKVRIDVKYANLEVFADPLFEKVFYNLIDNALRYGGEKMTTIRVFSYDAEDGRVIVFEDDGAGIPAEDKTHLFERGFGKNSGLGLFLTREILQITGLSITETGTPGNGARFEILVPMGAYRFTSP